MSKVVKLEWGLNKKETEIWIDDMANAGKFTPEQANKLHEANLRR